MKTKVNEVKITYKPFFTYKVQNSQDIVNYLRSIKDFKNLINIQESVVAVFLNRKNMIICHQVISRGSITESLVDLRILFCTALKCLATNLVVSHNHPSGNLRYSESDKKLKNEIINAGKFFQIQLTDFIILTDSGYTSFADEDILTNH